MVDISLITSLYKSETFLETYIGHVIELAQAAYQAGLTLEMVIIPNDASEIERTLLTQLQHALTTAETATLQIHYVPRETLYASWNRGFNAAHGTVFGVWNVDDNRTLAALITGHRLLTTEDYLLVDFPFYEIVEGNPTYHPPQFDPQTCAPKTSMGPFWLCHRRLWQQVGEFNTQFRIAGDYEWSKRPAVRAAKSFIADVIAGEFLTHGDNLSASQDPLEWVEYNVVMLWHGDNEKIIPAKPHLMRQIWQSWGHQGATLPDDTAQWLWGTDAQKRYQRYLWERQLPRPMRKLWFALAKRGLVRSVDWDLHHGR